MATKLPGSPDPDRIDPTRRIESGTEKSGTPLEQPGQSFQSMMEGAPTRPEMTQQAVNLSPFDLAHGQTTLPSAPNFNTLLGQAKAAQSTLGGIQNQLSTPQLKLKR